MTAYDFAGLVAGLAGIWLLVAAVVIALAATLRLAAVRGRPGKGRLARGALAFAAVVGAAGIALFIAADFAPFRRTLDRGAGALVAGIVLAGLAAGWRSARSRPTSNASCAVEPEQAVKPAPPIEPG